MRQLLIALGALAATLLVGLTSGCSSQSHSAQASDPALGFTPVNPGTLTVATNLPDPGFWNGDSPDTITGGFEYGMAQQISQRLHLNGVRVVNVSFDALVAGQTNNFDVALSTVTITPQRAKVIDFSPSYFDSDQGVLVRTGTSVTETNAKDLRWGVQASSTSQQFVLDKIHPTSQPSVYQDQPSMFSALAGKQIDAVLLDTVSVLPVAKQSNGELQVVAQYRTGDAYGAVFPKGSPQAPLISTIISDMKKDGTLQHLTEQYLTTAFGSDPTTIPYLQP